MEYNSDRIAQLYADLAGDGWKVETVVAPTFTHSAFRSRGGAGNGTVGLFGYRYPEILRNRIRAIYDANPAEVKQIYFLGHTPIALSGVEIRHPDGHGSRAIYATDHYYADMDGIWSDKLVNSTDTALSSTAYGVPNIPGDGIWDPSYLPSEIEIGVGRVDPWDRENNQWFGLSQPELIARYLDKANKYRHNEPFGFPGEEMRAGLNAMVRGPAGQTGASHTSGQFLNIVGPQHMPFDFVQTHNRPTPVDPVTNGDVQITVDKGPFLFWGQSTSGPSSNDTYRRSVFNHGMQSWWGDWHIRSGMRSATMDEGMVLSWIYTGRFDGQIFYYPMGIGESLGSVMRLSSNFEEEEILEGRDPDLKGNSETREFLRALMADPSLRAFVVPPVQALNATVTGNDVILEWTPPHDTADLVSYQVLRADDIRGDFELRSSGLTETTFTDVDAPAGPKVYMVQAVFLKEGGSGTLFVNSQGIFAKVGLKLDTPLVPPLPIGEDVDFTFAASQAEGDLTWSAVSGQLPDGVTLSSLGQLSGNPVVGGEYPVRLRVSDSGGSSVERNFVIFVDASFTEVIDLDLRSENGLGLYDRAMPGRPVSLLGDAHLSPEGGMRFDGDGDALRLHNIGQASNGEWGNFTYSPGNIPHYSVSFSFKADPESGGGVLVSKSASISGTWNINDNHFTIRMNSQGAIEAWNRNYGRLTSAPGFNDGQWHSVTLTADPSLPIEERILFYVDGTLVGSQRQGDKNPSVDFLVGARWEDADAGLITDEFDGWIADLRYTVENVGSGEVQALHERLMLDRPDLTPVVPLATGLPMTLDVFPGREKIFPFTVLDQAGQPIRPYVFHDNPSAIEHIEVMQTAQGYALKIVPTSNRGETAQVTIGLDNGYPGFTGVTTLTYRAVGPRHVQLAAASGVASLLDVMANDVHPAERLLVMDGIASHPVYADNPSGPRVGGLDIIDGRVHFHPPTLWTKAIRFEYRLRDPVTGETEIAEVVVSPLDQPDARDDEFVLRGTESGLLDVLANDSDPLGGGLEIVAVTQPNAGRVRVEGGQVRYFPQVGGGSGSTDFIYTVRNGAGIAAEASVSVLYGNAGGPPLVNLSMEENEGSTLFNDGLLGEEGHGNLVGATPVWSESPDGRALDLSDHNGIVNLGNPAGMDFNPATDSFSIMVALETTALSTTAYFPMTLIGKGVESAADTQLSLGFEDYSVVVHIKNERIVANQQAPSALDGENFGFYSSSAFQWWNTEPGMEKWRVFTVVNDADTQRLKIYYSQHLIADVDTSEMDFDVDGNGFDWLLGGAPNGSGGHHRFLQGAVDNLRIYDWAIPESIIRETFHEMNFRVRNFQPRVFNLHPAPGTELEMGKSYLFTVEMKIGEPDEAEEEYAISTGAIYRVGEGPLEMIARINRSLTDHIQTPIAGPVRSTQLLVTPDRLGRLTFNASLKAVRNPDDPEASSSTPIGYSSTSYTVVESAAPVPDRVAIASPSDLGVLALAQPATLDLALSGGAAPFYWETTQGLLPPGMTLDADGGTVNGTPNVEGTFVFGLRVTGGDGVFDEKVFQVSVAPFDSDGNQLPDEWEFREFGSVGVDPSATPPEGGLPHLLRFALGADLLEAGGSQWGMGMRRVVGPMVDGNNRYLALQFERRRERGPIQLILESSPDLSNWDTRTPVRLNVIWDDGEIQTVEALFPEPDEDRGFYRIRSDL